MPITNLGDFVKFVKFGKIFTAKNKKKEYSKVSKKTSNENAMPHKKQYNNFTRICPAFFTLIVATNAHIEHISLSNIILEGHTLSNEEKEERERKKGKNSDEREKNVGNTAHKLIGTEN